MTLRGAEGIARVRMRALGLWEPAAETPQEVVRQLVAMQAQEHPYARWSVGQRTRRPRRADVDAAYDEGRILRTHVLRPTWHYVAREDLRWVLALSGPLVNARNARRYAELELDVATRARATDLLVAALDGASRTRAELAAVLEQHDISTAQQRMPHLLMHAELHAAICSGPMRGTQTTYAALDDRVPPAAAGDDGRAAAELARRYFTTRGPATLRDFGWWSGLPAAQARQALHDVCAELESAEVDGRTYWSGPQDRVAGSGGADLIQLYDEVVISYRESRDVLASAGVNFKIPLSLDGFPHIVLLDGRLLGHWRVVRGRAGDGDVETRPARALTRREESAVEAAVSRYQAFLTDR